MENETKLKDLVTDDAIKEHIVNWEYEDIKPEILRVYYKVHDTGKNGFQFCVVECEGSPSGCLEPEASISVIYDGVAYYDGIRHFCMGYDQSDRSYGYLNYPDLDEHIEILNKLKEFIKKYCNAD